MIAETRAEWLITAYACYKNNLTVVTIYTNLGKLLEGVRETFTPSHDIFFSRLWWGRGQGVKWRC